MIFNAIYNISAQHLDSAILFDNRALVSVDVAVPLAYHRTGGSAAITHGSWPAIVHHDGNMNFALSVFPQGRERLAFDLKRRCREWEKVVEGEGGPLMGDCRTLDLYAFEYGCTDQEIEESRNWGGSTLGKEAGLNVGRRGLASY